MFIVQTSNDSQTWADECKFWDKPAAVKYAKVIEVATIWQRVRVLDEEAGIQEYISQSR